MPPGNPRLIFGSGPLSDSSLIPELAETRECRDYEHAAYVSGSVQRIHNLRVHAPCGKPAASANCTGKG